MSEEEIDIDREKIIDKAVKLRELANRGIGGEKENAIRMLKKHIEKNNITDEEMQESSERGNTWYDHISKEERKTPFAKWFKRSVTVDRRNNEPLKFFHKSRSTTMFNEFEHGKGSKMYGEGTNYGFHFVLEEDKSYIRHIGEYYMYENKVDGVEYNVFLKMIKPYYIFARLNGESYGQNGEQYRPIQITKELVYSLILTGYDSIIIQDQYGVNVYIVFTPNQIKATTNNGEYSNDNHNIFC
jgi:hypothetical protein